MDSFWLLYHYSNKLYSYKCSLIHIMIYKYTVHKQKESQSSTKPFDFQYFYCIYQNCMLYSLLFIQNALLYLHLLNKYPIKKKNRERTFPEYSDQSDDCAKNWKVKKQINKNSSFLFHSIIQIRTLIQASTH